MLHFYLLISLRQYQIAWNDVFIDYHLTNFLYKLIELIWSFNFSLATNSFLFKKRRCYAKRKVCSLEFAIILVLSVNFDLIFLAESLSWYKDDSVSNFLSV